MGEICARHGVLVVSDEIHQDLVLNPARKHIPFASLGEEFAQNSITCTAPSKTFNLPGLQSANIFVPNRRLREELARQYERNMFPQVNVLGMVAAEAAYAHGEPWLEELLGYLRGNHAHFARAVNSATDVVRVLPADSLYLAWMDCRGLGMDAEALGSVHAHKGAAVAGQRTEVRPRGPRVHAREPRLPPRHGRRSRPAPDHGRARAGMTERR